MKKIYFLLAILILANYSLLAQNPIFVEKITLDAQVNSSTHYVASQYINCIPNGESNGFGFDAETAGTFVAEIDPYMIILPGEGDEVGGPPGSDEEDHGVVGSIDGSFSVTPTGAATYSVPIELPVGTAGLMPEISLNYNSLQSMDGELGPGWSIGGLSVITMVNQSIYYDGKNHPINFQDPNDDAYMLDGQRLIRHSLSSHQYRTENWDFSFIRHDVNSLYDIDYWIVKTKDGLTKYYGQTGTTGNSDDSKLYLNSDDKQAIMYFLKEVRDQYGNYIKYYYDKSSSYNSDMGITGRSIVLSRIEYTGHVSEDSVTDPACEVVFNYDNKKTVNQDDYWGGIYLYQDKRTIITNKKLTSIISKVKKLDGSIENYREYEFKYISDGTSNLAKNKNVSFLHKIYMKSKESSKNPIVFDWDFYSFIRQDHSNLDLDVFDDISSTGFLDIDLDGDMDIYKLSNSKVRFFYNEGNETCTDSSDEIEIDGTDLTFFDYDGDGENEFVYIKVEDGANEKEYLTLNELKIWFSNEASNSLEYQLIPLLSDNSMEVSGLNNNKIIPGDFDADGKTDCIISVANETNFLLYGKNNLGTVSWDDNGIGDDEDFLPLYHCNVIDYDGNGSSNLLLIEQNQAIAKVYKHQNSQIVEYNNLGTNLFTGLNNENVSFIPANFNNDNKSDLIRYRYNWGANMEDTSDDYFQVDFYLGTYNTFGNGGYVKIPQTIHIDDVTLNRLYFGDSNGDGLTDVIKTKKQVFDMPNEDEYDWTLETHTKVYEYNLNPVTFELDDNIIFELDGTISRFLFSNIPKYSSTILYEVNVPYCRRYKYTTSQGFVAYKFERRWDDFACFNGLKKLNGNQISSITSSLGSKINIQYGNMMLSGHYTNDKFSYPNQLYNFQNSLDIVEIVKYDNGINNLELWDLFFYKNAVATSVGLGFLGFEEFTQESNSNGTKTTSYGSFSQTMFPGTNNEQTLYIPAVCSTKTWNTATGNILNETIYTWGFEHGASPYSWGNFRFSDKQNYILYAKEVINKLYEDGEKFKIEKTTNTIDNYGNYTDVIVESGVEESNLPFIVYNKNYYNNKVYSNDGNSVIWHLGRLYKAKVTKTLPDGTTQTKESEFEYYAETGSLWKEIMEPDHILKVEKEYVYDKYGNIEFSHVKTKNWNNKTAIRTKQSIYDERGRFVTEVKKEINGLNYSTKTKYNDVTGLLEEKTDINGFKTFTFYNDFGEIKRSVDPLGSEVKTIVRWVDDNDAFAPPHALYFIWGKSSSNMPTIKYYNRIGQILREVSYSDKGKAVFTDIEYDNLRRESKKYYPYFANENRNHYIESKYDNLNRIEKIIEPGNITTQFFYDGLTKKVLDANLNPREKEFNVLGDLVKSTDAISFISYLYTYINEERVESVTDEFGNTISVTYDIIGNKKELNDPDLGLIKYDHDGFGNLIKKTDNSNNEFYYEYDDANRIVHSYNSVGDEDIRYSYDNIENKPNSLGKLDKVWGDNEYEEFFYDEYGRNYQTEKKVDTKTFITQNKYDSYGRIKEFTYPSGLTIRNIYNQYGALEKIKNKDSQEILWELNEVNAHGQIQKFTYGNGVLNTYEFYEETGMIENIIATGIQHMYYTWDNVGNLTSRHDKTQNTLFESFIYDNLNRLTEYSVNTVGNPRVYMEYDNIGNIKYKSDIVVYDGTHSNKYQYNVGLKPHAVAGIPDILMSPERISQEINYNSFNKVSRIEQNGKELFLTYGNNRQRVKQEIKQNGVLLAYKYYVDDIYEEVFDSEGIKKVHYIHSPSGLAAIYTEKSGTNELNYVHNDHLGSIQYLSDIDGNIVEAFSYDAWGKRRDPNTWLAYEEIPEGASVDRGFTGHEHLDLFELVNMNGRIYDPVIARFLSPDPFVQAPDFSQGLNRYSYAWNNPLVHIDPSGYNNLAIAATFMGVMIGGIITTAIAGPAGFAAYASTVGAVVAAATVTLAGAAGALVSGIILSMQQGVPINQAFGQVFVGTIMGGLSATVTYGIGSLELFNLGFFNAVGKAAMHATYNGITSITQGGKFIHGFVSAGIGSMSGFVSNILSIGLAGDIFIAAALGGTASALTGGNFANGAATAAFVVLFNHTLHQDGKKRRQILRPVQQEMSDDLKNKLTELFKEARRINTTQPEYDVTEGGWIEETLSINIEEALSLEEGHYRFSETNLVLVLDDGKRVAITCSVEISFSSGDTFKTIDNIDGFGGTVYKKGRYYINFLTDNQVVNTNSTPKRLITFTFRSKNHKNYLRDYLN